MALPSPPVSDMSHLPSIAEGAALMALPSPAVSDTSHLPSIAEGAASMALPSPPLSNTSHLPSVAEEMTCTNEKEIVPCTPQPEPEPVTVIPTKISVNPLACLAIAANKARESLPELPSDPNGSKIENEGLVIPSTTTKSAKGNVKVPGRMRPSPTKNGRNLCALRWLKRIQPNGTTEDFQKYYNSLSADKVKSYVDEAYRLKAVAGTQRLYAMAPSTEDNSHSSRIQALKQSLYHFGLAYRLTRIRFAFMSLHSHASRTRPSHFHVSALTFVSQ
ncbi:hypothetical protein M404DRAFT_36394 [Pisolithus tinctorius Marx 270]|uniref:Uncharacterized protein n=1 Tax=Pisolithus tinctorius Marx 270 TaxID=870435 RepID=A0A0C3NB28_PISTI|nr:hypothetical protein M404DRAFT_36394 [Pisolithus tinctorius Marx 270]